MSNGTTSSAGIPWDIIKQAINLAKDEKLNVSIKQGQKVLAAVKVTETEGTGATNVDVNLPDPQALQEFIDKLEKAFS